MFDNKSLVLDLVEWVATAPRDYDAVMDAWRTSCPRLSIWEDAVDAGLVERRNEHRRDIGSVSVVYVTDAGREFLTRERPNWFARSA